MRATISSATKSEIQKLIRESKGGTLGEHDQRLLDTCLMFTETVRVGLVQGQAVCAWGLIPPTLLSNSAYLWLYTTEGVRDHEFLFVRNSQRVIEGLLKEYDSINGHAHVTNTRAIRWLRWLGATFSEPVNDTLPFTIKRKHG